MANLAEKTIDTQGEYKRLDTLLGVTFSSGKTYYIQCRNVCRLIESASTPTEGGFVYNPHEVSQAIYECKNGAKLYIKTTSSPVPVNVAD